MKLHELGDKQLVDTIRVIIGLDPLHFRESRDAACGSYLRLEALRRAADPDCATCGGSGYFDGVRIEARCACTGLPQRDLSSQRAPAEPNRAFARPKGRRWAPRAQP